MRLRRIGVVVAVLAVLAALAHGGAVRAGTEPGKGEEIPAAQWPTVECAVGEFTGIGWVGDELLLSGSAQACESKPPADARFGVVFYTGEPTAVVGINNMRPYSMDQPRQFAVRLYPVHSTVACLHSAPGVRLACAELSLVGAVPRLNRIATDDPRVRAPVTRITPIVGTPECASCV
jgi:hypothetical protein